MCFELTLGVCVIISYTHTYTYILLLYIIILYYTLLLIFLIFLSPLIYSHPIPIISHFPSVLLFCSHPSSSSLQFSYPFIPPLIYKRNPPNLSFPNLCSDHLLSLLPIFPLLSKHQMLHPSHPIPSSQQLSVRFPIICYIFKYSDPACFIGVDG